MNEIDKLQKLVDLFEERCNYHIDICRAFKEDDIELDVAKAFVAGMSRAYSEAALEVIYAQADYKTREKER